MGPGEFQNSAHQCKGLDYTQAAPLRDAGSSGNSGNSGHHGPVETAEEWEGA